MTQPTHTTKRPTDSLTCGAIERAKHLMACRPQGETSAAWSHEAAHVGDLSVLVLTLLD